MMKKMGKAVGLFGMLAGVSTMVAMFAVACSGDDNNDGGTDSGTDVTSDTQTPDVQPDVAKDVVNDVVDASDANPVATFKDNVDNSVCTRFQTCCNGLDAGTFDIGHCKTAAAEVGWNNSNSELTPDVVARGNVVINSSAATSCLADLGTLDCPSIPSSEINTVTDNCFAAATGTLNVGDDCVASVECKTTEFCQFDGVDAGTSDGGSVLGKCATLVGDGGLCGQGSYGVNFQSDECGYKGWHPPPAFCSYDTYPDQTGYDCHPLRANAADCFFDNECLSGICGNYGQDCSATTCTCLTTRDFTQFCSDLAIKDAGTD